MEFPIEGRITTGSMVYRICNKTLNKYIARYGVYARLFYCLYDGDDNNPTKYISEIYFDIDGHRFECLKDLKRAMENKAFL